MDKVGMGKVLRRHVERTYKTHREAADNWSVSPSYLSAVLNGKRTPTAAMLKDVGYECLPYSPQFVRSK